MIVIKEYLECDLERYLFPRDPPTEPQWQLVYDYEGLPPDIADDLMRFDCIDNSLRVRAGKPPLPLGQLRAHRRIATSWRAGQLEKAWSKHKEKRARKRALDRELEIDAFHWKVELALDRARAVVALALGVDKEKICTWNHLVRVSLLLNFF